MEYSVAGLAEQRQKVPQYAKVGVILLIVSYLVTRSIPETAAIVFAHWFAHMYMFPSVYL
jgi:hypothetical protein